MTDVDLVEKIPFSHFRAVIRGCHGGMPVPQRPPPSTKTSDRSDRRIVPWPKMWSLSPGVLGIEFEYYGSFTNFRK